MMETVEKKKRSTVSKAKDAEIDGLRKRIVVLEADNEGALKVISQISCRNRFLARIIAFESFALAMTSVAIVMLLRR